MYPIAQPDCIRPTALPRCLAGQVSATSTEPAAHSPPSPIPTSDLQSTSSGSDRAVAVNPVNTE